MRRRQAGSLSYIMNIDLSNFDMGPGWKQSAPGSKLPPKKDKKQKPSPALVRRSSCEGGKGDGIVRVGRETKGRKGAGVTVITGIQSHPEGLEKLAKQFKQQCGTGGTVKNGIIEIQGDHRDQLVAELQKLGYTVKKSGG
jgi:translation initiation factor 1